MSISHGGFTFLGVTNHEPVTPDGNIDAPRNDFSYFGVVGESHMLDRIKGRNLSTVITLSGYASEATLQADVDTITNLVNTLTGTLTVTVQSVSDTYTNCTFTGAQIVTKKSRDGRGIPPYGNGWWCKMKLEWREIAT